MPFEFPSGPWRGYWLYPGSAARHKMRLDLKFAAARVMGDGDDEIGYFVINGKYDAEGGTCAWTKTYPRSHQVFYTGARDARGISGVWATHPGWSGGFAIWPGEHEEGFADETEEADSVTLLVPG